MEPGLREPAIDRIVIGDLMRATESCVAGFTETGSLTGVGVGWETSTEFTTGVSTTMSTVSSGGVMSSISCCWSSSSGGSSSTAWAISTWIASLSEPVTAVTTMRTTMPSTGRSIARIGAARR